MQSFSAELLVRARPHWMETADTTGWSKDQLKEKNTVTTKGSPIVVKPDGWKWGKKECPPNFIIIKLPGVTVEKCLKYIESLRDTTLSTLESQTKKERKYIIRESLIDSTLDKQLESKTYTEEEFDNTTTKQELSAP